MIHKPFFDRFMAATRTGDKAALAEMIHPDFELVEDGADVVEPEQIPPTVVTMNSTVRFSIDSSGEDFCLTLVYPKDVDGSGNTISILAPVGSALLGLSTGDEIEWPRPGGGTIKVRIVEIIYQPERAGKFHR